MTRRSKTHWPPVTRIRHDVVTAFLIAAVAAGAQALTWTTHGPTRGEVTDIAAAASAPRTLYATTTAGVFRSDDAGDTWRDVSGGVRGVTHVVVDPTNAETAYITTTSTVFKTTNGGGAWRDVGGTLHSQMSTSSLLIDPTNPSTLYLGSRCGPIGFKGGPVAPLVSSSDPFGGAGVYKSTDGGETWALKINGMIGRSFAVCVEALALDPAQPQHLFATPLYSDGGSSESIDGGETWTRAPALVPADVVVAHPQFPTVRYGVSPNSFAFLVSNDGGQTWSRTTTNSFPRQPRTTAIDPSTARLFLGTDAGVFRSGDGGTTWVDTRLVTAPVNRIVVDTAVGFVYAATASGVYRMPLPLGPWSEIDMHDISANVIHVATDPNDPPTAFAGTADYFVSLPIGAGSRLFSTHDNGGSWQLVRVGGDIAYGRLSVDGAHNVYVNVVADPKRVGWLYRIYNVASTPVVQYSRDGGATWTTSQAPAAAWIALDPSKPSTIYVVGDPNYGKVAIARSDDSGLTWKTVLPGNTTMKFLTVAPSSSSTLYRLNEAAAGCDNGGYAFSRSDDGGATWLDFGWPDACGYYPQALAVDPRDARSVWVVSYRNRILHTPDGGATWEIPAQPPGTVNDIAFSSDGATLHATVAGGGVWETSVAGPHHRPARR